jgi:hypothetical protein
MSIWHTIEETHISSPCLSFLCLIQTRNHMSSYLCKEFEFCSNYLINSRSKSECVYLLRTQKAKTWDGIFNCGTKKNACSYYKHKLLCHHATSSMNLLYNSQITLCFTISINQSNPQYCQIIWSAFSFVNENKQTSVFICIIAS